MRCTPSCAPIFFFFLSFLPSFFFDTCLHPNGTLRDIAGFHFAIHSRVALETRGRGGEGTWKCMENGRGSCEEALCLRWNDHRWRMRPRRRRPSIYKTHERETHGRTLIATGRNATRGWLIAVLGDVSSDGTVLMFRGIEDSIIWINWFSFGYFLRFSQIKIKDRYFYEEQAIFWSRHLSAYKDKFSLLGIRIYSSW